MKGSICVQSRRSSPNSKRRLGRAVPLVLAFCLPATSSFAHSITNTIRFTELSRRPVNGLTFSNVTFAFTIAGTPSTDAYFGGSGPHNTVYVSDPSLEGSTRGTLTLNFLSPTRFISFGVALSAMQTNFTPGLGVQLFDPSLQPLGVLPVNTQVLTNYTEAFFSYHDTLVSRAIIRFTQGAPRFAMDNLSYTIGLNSAPVAYAQSVQTPEDTAVSVTLSATDADGDPLTYSFPQPSHGTLTGSAPSLIYAPDPNYFGPDSFTFTASDGEAQSEVAAVNIVVIPVNDPPVAVVLVTSPTALSTNPPNLEILAPTDAGALVILDGSLSSDVETDPLNYLWYVDGSSTPFAAGVRTTNVFSVGTHSILLVVSDGMDTATNGVVLEIFTAAQAVQALIAALEDSGFAWRNTRPLIATLEVGTAAFERGNVNVGIQQLEVFEKKVQIQVAPYNPTLAEAIIGAAQEIINALAIP